MSRHPLRNILSLKPAPCSVNEYLKPDLQLVRLMVRLSKHYQVKRYEQLALTHLDRLAPSGILDWLDYNDPTILKRLQASGNVACLSDFRWFERIRHV